MVRSETDPLSWIDRARADLKVATLVLSTVDVPDWPAGFHLQQAAEKALKALLVAHGRAAPRTHDLVLLAEAVESLEPALGAWTETLAPLGEFGVAQRYPGAPEPEVDLRVLRVEVAALVDAASVACTRGDTKQ